MSQVFFTDRDLGKTVPRILTEAGLRVEQHADHFLQTATDPEWIPEVGKRGWFALTRDKGIRYRTVERDAVMRAGVGLFILVGPWATHQELAENFVRTIETVERFIAATPRPFIARVYRPGPKEAGRPGRVSLWFPPPPPRP